MRKRMIELAHAHAAAEGSGDVEMTLNTLEPEPVYELQPEGRVLRGMDAVRRYYKLSSKTFSRWSKATRCAANG
jgi:hypothetical protein